MSTVTEPEAPQADPAASPTPEVITPEDTAALELANRQRQAVEGAADAALQPGVPGREEFLALCLQAKLMSMSAAVQKGLRDNPHLCLHVVMIARAMGIDPWTAAELIDFIPEDKDHPERGGNLGLSPKGRVAQVIRLGLGRVDLLEEPAADADRATAIALRPGGFIDRDVETGKAVAIHGEIGRSTFTWSNAQQAGLVDRRCEGPGKHWVKPNTPGLRREERCDCRQGYRTYPGRMLGWRAKGWACDDHFPESTVGLYSPDELGAVVDADGKMIDPATVEVPEGYQPKPAPPKPTLAEEERGALRLDIYLLDPEGRHDLRQMWDRANLPKLDSEDFGPGQANTARSLLRSVQSKRKKAGWKEEEARAWLVAQAFTLGGVVWAEQPEGQESPPEAPQGPETAGEPQPPTGAPETAQTAEEPKAPDGIPADAVTEIAEAVKRMHPTEVIAQLESRNKSTAGNQIQRQRRLAALICMEWIESNHPKPEA